MTVLGVPALQRLVVGAEVKFWPLAEPHWPFRGFGTELAEQVAVVPPLSPAQVQVQGPLPVTVLGVPALQRLVSGGVLEVPPLAEPHWPFTTCGPKGLNVAMTVQSAVITSVV